MRRLRFTSGLILGLLLGGLAGTVLGLLVLPPRSADQSGAASAQVQELTRRLQAATEYRERIDRQIEQFGELATRMTASFNSLEQRFKALEEEQRLREPRSAPPPPATQVVPSPSPVPTPQPPEAAGVAEPPASE